MVQGALAGATESAVIVPVPAAEPVVGRHRRSLDHSAVWGVPAHVTVLYPFVPPGLITERTVAVVGEVLADHDAFECTFSQVKWFDERVVWLAPDPDGPFRALMTAVWRRFPDYPPYRRAHLDPTPHLTVGSDRAGDLAGLRRAAATVGAELPISTWVDRVCLIAGRDAPESWRTVATFELPVGGRSYPATRDG